MPTANAIAQRLTNLLIDRQKHADAMAEIDATLARVAGVLTDGRSAKAISTPAGIPGTAGKKRRRRRGKFAVSGNDLILTFLKANPSATTAEIKKHWAAEGRAGGADNTLSLLVKAKELKRTPLGKGIRGSKFTVA
jgi:hypothetical protein